MRVGRRWYVIALLAGCKFGGHGSPVDADPNRPDGRSIDAPSGSDARDRDAAVVDAGVPDAAAPDAAPSSVVIEAEDPTSTMSLSGGYNWVTENALAGYTGTGYVTALPPTGTNCATWSATCGCVNTYAFTVTAAGSYRVTFRHSSPDTASDSVYWDVDGATPSLVTFNPDDNSFHDQPSGMVVLAAGAHAFHLWMRENGQRIDHIQIDPL